MASAAGEYCHSIWGIGSVAKFPQLQIWVIFRVFCSPEWLALVPSATASRHDWGQLDTKPNNPTFPINIGLFVRELLKASPALNLVLG
jgi:hypothetical protein